MTALLWSFLYFFFVLTSYYILRSIRDEKGIAGGVGALPWLFSATFAVTLLVVPMWAALVARVPRRRLLPIVYHFFAANLVVFYVVLRIPGAELAAGRAFYVWTSVFNLMAVTVFWSFMVDVWSREQGARLFGFISAGGSLGAVVGPLLTSTLVGAIEPARLLLLSAVMLEGACLCLARIRLAPAASGPAVSAEAAVGGTILSGLKPVFTSPYLFGIALYVLLLTFSGTFGYFLNANLVATALAGSVARTSFFARVDLYSNLLSLAIQALGTAAVMVRTGVGVALVALPLLCVAGFLMLGASPTLALLAVFFVARRGIEYALARPARDVLFTVVDREQKYKAKAFIDAGVYRSGDLLGAWAFTGLGGLGLGLPGRSLVAAAMCGVWTVVAIFVARRHDRVQATG